MQFWPRKKAKRPYSRVRSWKAAKAVKEAMPLAFAGYKAGMTHMIVMSTKNTRKPIETVVPVTVIECPPMKIASVRLYGKKKEGYGTEVVKEIPLKVDKPPDRKLFLIPQSSVSLAPVAPAQAFLFQT